MFYLLVCLLLSSCYISGEENPQPIVVHLKEPDYEAGTLSTTQGGVIKGPKFRLQAQNITYTKKKDGVHKVEASCFVMVDFGDYVFVGDGLKYDFETEEGVIYNGRTAEAPWYVGGEVIDLLADGSYLVHKAFITTSENLHSEWRVEADTIHLTKDKTVEAKYLTFRVMKAPLLWLPKLKLNLESLTDAPLHFYFRWGGQQGTKAGLKYKIFSWYNFQVFLRFDYRLKRGPGGGLETFWESEDRKRSLETINYVASDSSVENPHEKVRYRFQGLYRNKFDSTDVRVSWDKLSDKDMATDYADNGLELDGAERTELIVRHQREHFITNFIARARVNPFQTIKQELPTLELNFKPYVIGSSGVIWENAFEASYLDFAYANDIIHAPDFNSTRCEYTTKFLRPYQIGYLTLTPELGSTAIYYGNSPQNDDKLLALGLFGVTAHTTLSKTWENYKQVLEPYAKWTYLTAPTVSPPDHYIFDIDDGWARLNTVRIGVRQNIFRRSACYNISRLLTADLYTFAFITTPTQPTTFPKVFLDLSFHSLPTLKHTLLTAWDFRFNDLDKFNLRTDWTVSNDLAISCEWRHRSRFSFRKAVTHNYILESFRTVHELVHSQLSDRRDTLLVHLYYQFHPQWALELESRQGWHRRHEPTYNEYEIDLITRLQSHWNVKFSYQHKQGDHRIAIYMWLQFLKPCEDSISPLRPIEF